MGAKYDAGDRVFDPVIAELLPLKEQLGEEALHRIASHLVGGLLALGWGNAESTLGAYDGEPAIVAAFREHNVLLKCTSEHDGHGGMCEEEQGHHPATDHKDYQGRTWKHDEAIQ